MTSSNSKANSSSQRADLPVELSLQKLNFAYPESEALFSDFSFDLKRGEVASVVGMSGSGKSTLLKLLAGLLPWQEGEISFRGKPLEGPHEKLIPGHDEIVMVSQEFDLLPYQTVLENVQRHIKGDPKKGDKALRWLQRLGMKPFYDAKVETLSGGQKQRVAIAQALVAKPQVLLFDEPFSHLDPIHKKDLSLWLYKALKEVNKSAIFTFHDPKDAFRVSDIIWIMDKGRWVQKGSAQDLYDRPKNRLVAQLLGDVNYVSVEDSEALSKSYLATDWPMHRGKYLIRPEDAVWREWEDALEVTNEIFQGDHWLVEVKLPSGVSAFFRKSRQ